MVENIQQKRLFRNQSRICSKNLVQVTNLRNSGVMVPKLQILPIMHI
jgi:hypothetical protein